MRTAPLSFVRVTALALAIVGTASAQTPSWRVDFVGAAPPSWSGPVGALAVNDAGEVVGNTTVALIRRPWIGSPGAGLELLPLPPGTTYADAFDINASGVVAGRALVQGGSSRAVIWRPGPAGYEAVLLPSGPGGQFPFDARGINDGGDVVGKYGLFGSYHWNEATGVTQLTAFPALPEDINNRRQIIGDTYRMDFDTGVVENLGNPTGTGFRYIFSDLWRINDAGQCGGYGNVATGMTQSKQAVRYTDGPVWKAFNSQPARSANVMGIAASGDTAFHLGAGAAGSFVYVDGHGSVSLPNMPGPGFSGWDLTNSFAPVISRNGTVATNGGNAGTGQFGIVVLTPLGFDDLGGAAAGALGTPVLTGYGRLTRGERTRVRVASAAAGSPAVLALSGAASPFPLFGGTFYPNLASGGLLALSTDGMGRIDLTFVWPSTPPGTTLYFQAGILDPAATAGVSLSNALLAVAR